MVDRLFDDPEAGEEILAGRFALPLTERLLPGERGWLAKQLHAEMVLSSDDSCTVDVKGIITFMHRHRPLNQRLDPDTFPFSEERLHAALVTIVRRLLPEQGEALPAFEAFIPPAQVAVKNASGRQQRSFRAGISRVFGSKTAAVDAPYDEAAATELHRKQGEHDVGQLKRQGRIAATWQRAARGYSRCLGSKQRSGSGRK